MTNHILANLNKQQQEAVAETEGPSLIIAGPGSGKTKALTHKVAYLINEKKLAPSEILCLTFTNKAALEMKDRINQLLTDHIASPWISTFHSFCARMLRSEGHHLGLSKSFAIYDDNDSIALLKQLINQTSYSPNNIKAASVLNSINGAKNELIGPEEYAQYAHGYFQKTVAEIFPLYQKKLLLNDAVDFGDLLTKTVELFKQNQTILKIYQKRFKYILVDEYQDTNHAQYTLVKLLSATHSNICVVGDVNQAIYSWRGADFRNILQFERDFNNVKIFRLEQNYRSTKSIIKAASEVIKHGKNHLQLDLWTNNDDGEKVSLFEASNEQEEGEYIAMKILSEIKADSSLLNLKEELEIKNLDLSFDDYAVLYRTNAQSRALEDTFMRWGMPYRIVGGIKFYERKEVKDVLSYLRLIRNPQDSVALERVTKLGKKRKQRFEEYRPSIKVDGMSVIELLDQILKVTAYLDKYAHNTEEDRERKENVRELRTVAAQFADLDDFLENVSLVQNDQLPNVNFPKESAAINLMTLHSAKGLEFKTVFMIGMEEGLFPHNRALGSPDELEEERRLCYVGITRAKKKLHLTYARNRRYFGNLQFGVMSRFVQDIPPDLLQEHFSARV